MRNRPILLVGIGLVLFAVSFVVLHNLSWSRIRDVEEQLSQAKQLAADLSSSNQRLREDLARADATNSRTGDVNSPVLVRDSRVECPPATTIVQPCQETQQTSVSHPGLYWKNTGLSALEQECENTFGASLVDRWRDRQEPYCRGASTISCARYQQPRHSGPDIMCDGTNIAVHFGRLQMSGKGTMFGEDGHFKFSDGTLEAVCKKESVFTLDKFPMCQKDLMGGLRAVSSQPTCDRTVSHPVILVIRYEYKNLFHQMTDFINAYMVAEMAGVDLQTAQVVLLDNHPMGPFEPLWHGLAPAHKVMQAKDFGSDSVCFDRVLFPVLGYGAPIAKDINRNNECPDSVLMQSFTRHVLRNLNLLDAPVPSRPVITLISRKDYDGRSLARKIDNEDELAQAIEGRLSNGEFRRVDFASISFREQLEVIRSSNILIGMHGAGLSHLVFLPKEAVVIELFQGDQPKHYRNFAKWADKQYMAFRSGSHVDVTKFLTALDGAVRLARSFNDQHEPCGLSC